MRYVGSELSPSPYVCTAANSLRISSPDYSPPASPSPPSDTPAYLFRARLIFRGSMAFRLGPPPRVSFPLFVSAPFAKRADGTRIRMPRRSRKRDFVVSRLATRRSHERHSVFIALLRETFIIRLSSVHRIARAQFAPRRCERCNDPN